MRHQMTLPNVLVALLAAGISLLATASAAQDYFPLYPGWSWQYQRVGGGGVLLVDIVGTLEIFGQTTFVRHNVITGTGAQVFDNYWSRDGQGQVLLHGAHNEDGFTAFYDPPIVYIEAPPLMVGDEWCTSYLFYDSPDDPDPTGPYDYCAGVLDQQMVTVPVGTFDGFFVDSIEPVLARRGARYGILGNRIEGRDVPTSSCYAAGTGMIIYVADGAYELTGASGPVAVQPSTWGGIKALYRD
jgi:hypothetical protein